MYAALVLLGITLIVNILGAFILQQASRSDGGVMATHGTRRTWTRAWAWTTPLPELISPNWSAPCAARER